MLRLGVAIPQIKMQMQFQGLNPDIIEFVFYIDYFLFFFSNPDSPAPEGGAVASSAPGSRALSRSASSASVAPFVITSSCSYVFRKEPPAPPVPAQASESSSEEEEEADKSANLSSVFPAVSTGPPLPVAEPSDATPPPPPSAVMPPPPPSIFNSQVYLFVAAEKQGESSSESESEEED